VARPIQRKADEGSIRAELLKNFTSTGMTAVNLSSNGTHMSAGPLEGLVELRRFMSDHDNNKLVQFSGLSFGAYLAKLGLEGELEKLASNLNLNFEGKTESVFDATEEKSYDEAGAILKKGLGK